MFFFLFINKTISQRQNRKIQDVIDHNLHTLQFNNFLLEAEEEPSGESSDCHHQTIMPQNP